MKYILDTDILIYFLKGQVNVVEKITGISGDQIGTTIINQSELLFGAFNSIKKKENLKKIEPFLQELTIISFCTHSAYLFAQQKALLKKQGKIIADLDLMIASIVLHHGCTLITNNTRHFERIKTLKIENWA